MYIKSKAGDFASLFIIYSKTELAVSAVISGNASCDPILVCPQSWVDIFFCFYRSSKNAYLHRTGVDKSLNLGDNTVMSIF